MKRQTCKPRSYWKQRAEECGFMYHSIDGTYWDESAYYEFSMKQIEELETATNEVHKMFIAAAEHVIKNDMFRLLGINDRMKELAIASWERDDFHLYGRFDFAYDGRNPPKVYEYNADTPTGLYEASVFQWEWVEDTRPGCDQFNSIHESLVERWKAFSSSRLYFSCVSGHKEDLGNTLYLMDTALQAGHNCAHIEIQNIGWNGVHFVDMDERRIENLFKLYPWEWLCNEEFGKHLEAIDHIIEPAWKMIWSNKGILPVMWELFQGHPNLLEAHFEHNFRGNPSNYAQKPIHGREGANIILPGIDSQTGDYTDSGWIYQKMHLLPNFAGNYPVVGSWTVDGESCGIGIREDASPITKDTSRFVPHVIV